MTNTTRIHDKVEAIARELGYGFDGAIDGLCVPGKDEEYAVLQFDGDNEFRVLIADFGDWDDEPEIKWSSEFEFIPGRVDVEAMLESARVELKKAIDLL